jgi:hypothetical protein
MSQSSQKYPLWEKSSTRADGHDAANSYFFEILRTFLKMPTINKEQFKVKPVYNGTARYRNFFAMQAFC